MPRKKVEKDFSAVDVKLAENMFVKPEEAVKYQTHCKCGANLAQTGYVENNYVRFCGPACAA